MYNSSKYISILTTHFSFKWSFLDLALSWIRLDYLNKNTSQFSIGSYCPHDSCLPGTGVAGFIWWAFPFSPCCSDSGISKAGTCAVLTCFSTVGWWHNWLFLFPMDLTVCKKKNQYICLKIEKLLLIPIKIYRGKTWTNMWKKKQSNCSEKMTGREIREK